MVRAGRRGHLLLEMLIALALGLMVLGSLVAVVTAALRWNRALIARAEGLEVARTVWFVLEEELRSERIGRDWTLDEVGVLALRAFRGLGRICSSDDGAWIVAYRGRRAPDVSRDSLLVLGNDGLWLAHPLQSVQSQPSAEACGEDEGETAMRMTWGGAGPARPLLVRVFERGSYHLEERAFRYRSGGGGRQPLTVERVSPTSRFDTVEERLQVTLDISASGDGDRPAPKRLVWRVGEVAP